MDFLNSVKKQLAEMEEQARLLQAMEASGVSKGPDGRLMFQPRQGQPQGEVRPGGGKQGGGKNKKQQRHKSKQGQGRAQQQSQQPRSLVSHEEVFETPHCATEGRTVPAAAPAAASLQSRVLSTLHGRSDEAFLLSEILGPPRCVRGWADD